MLKLNIKNTLHISKYTDVNTKNTLNHIHKNIRYFSIFNNEDEKQYLSLVENVIYNGEKRYTRNGYTYSIFGHQMKYDLKNNTLPLLTTKKVAWKTCLKELLWFISGETNNKLLRLQNVHIWNDNSTREFLDSRGLFDYEEDELGPIYGHQWRKFNAPYNLYGNTYTYTGIDQLQYIIDCLTNKNKEGPYSRRLIISAWNPCQLDIMALPPCHVLFQFYVNTKNEVSCQLYQRSGDIGLGIPFNIASYGFLTHLIAKHCGLKTGSFIHTIGDAHIYEEHIEPLKKQLERTPYPFPKVYISEKRGNIDDYIFDDFKVVDYKYHSQIKMDMKA
jgi:thymidylate synthase